MMKIEVKNNCPLDGFKPCRQTECAWFTEIKGKDPQSSDTVDHWGCAMAWMPLLLVENAQQSRATGAAIEGYRNAMVANIDRMARIVPGATTPRIQG